MGPGVNQRKNYAPDSGPFQARTEIRRPIEPTPTPSGRGRRMPRADVSVAAGSVRRIRLDRQSAAITNRRLIQSVLGVPQMTHIAMRSFVIRLDGDNPRIA